MFDKISALSKIGSDPFSSTVHHRSPGGVPVCAARKGLKSASIRLQNAFNTRFQHGTAPPWLSPRTGMQGGAANGNPGGKQGVVRQSIVCPFPPLTPCGRHSRSFSLFMRMRTARQPGSDGMIRTFAFGLHLAAASRGKVSGFFVYLQVIPPVCSKN